MESSELEYDLCDYENARRVACFRFRPWPMLREFQWRLCALLRRDPRARTVFRSLVRLEGRGVYERVLEAPSFLWARWKLGFAVTPDLRAAVRRQPLS